MVINCGWPYSHSGAKVIRQLLCAEPFSTLCAKPLALAHLRVLIRVVKWLTLHEASAVAYHFLDFLTPQCSNAARKVVEILK